MYLSTASLIDIADHPPDDLVDIAAFEHLLAHAVEGRALVIHHFVVFEQILAREEVSLFDLLLGAEDALGDALVLDRHPLFHAEPAEHLDRPLAGEHLHQLVFQRDVEARRSRIALPAAAAAKLVVDSAGGVALGADHVQARRLSCAFLGAA